MAEHMTTAEYLRLTAKPKASKYKNVKVKIDGITFDSRAESEYYLFLKAMQAAGEISHFMMQVPFILDGGVRYRLDFMVVLICGDIDYVDIKGMETEMFKLKKKQVEARYPIKIRCLYKTIKGFVEK
ncbi:MAG: DUF1064 domain-containing protein [Gammaproteobacteria bacterium]|nr:DUF1064 domain-containing protein [Gammaproteobacteria bacterium]